MSQTPPLCKICGNRHWGSEHTWTGEQQKKPQAPKQAPQKPQPSPTTKPHKHNCFWCGKEFTGTAGKIYCSNTCRLASWRNTQNPQKLPWAKKRFNTLQRDNFRCQFCGHSAQDGFVLHTTPKSPGSDDLITTCQECALAK